MVALATAPAAGGAALGSAVPAPPACAISGLFLAAMAGAEPFQVAAVQVLW
jgi:hypothetical protein